MRKNSPAAPGRRSAWSAGRLWLTGLLLAAAAAEPGAETLGSSSAPLTVDKTITLWTNNGGQVPVCWESTGYDREKKIVKDAVLGTWAYFANLDFPGWDNCPTSGDAQHVRMRIDAYGSANAGAAGSTSQFGTAALSKAADSRPAIVFQFRPDGKADQSRVEYVGVHEMGHVLGFLHEQDGPNNIEGPAYCDQVTGSNDRARAVTVYDPNSVMNYCNKFGNSRGDLSDLDIQGLQALYGVRRKNLAPRNSCVSALSANPVSLAAPWNDGGMASIAVFPSDRSKFLYHSQWSLKDGGWMDTVRWMAGDFNGDGLTDIAAAWNNGGTNVLTVRQSTGSGFIQNHWLLNAGGWLDSTQWLPGDFNGDGRTDVAAVWNSDGKVSIAVFLSDGSKFPTWTQWAVQDGGWLDTTKWIAADFDGDGRTDLAAAWNNGGNTTLTVRRSTGSSFSHEHWLVNAGNWTDSSTFLAGDFDKDGRADVIRLWNDLGQATGDVYLSGGASFLGALPWFTRDGGWASEIKWSTGDFTGDGRTDLVAAWNNGGTNVLTVRRSSGSSFSQEHWSLDAGGWMDSTAWCAGRYQ